MKLKTRPMAAVAAPQPRRWSREEYYALAEQGWFQGQRVELIDGEIWEMSPQHELHFQAILLAGDVLRDAFGPGHTVRPQGPLKLGAISDPEPDLAVVPGSARDYVEHPTNALLVVEVSESSLAFDRSHKASLYAFAGIQEYWIINLVARQLEVHRDPIPDTQETHGFRYDDVTTLRGGDAVSPLAAPQAMIRVADLLP
jgi:Uma2 family endonuclease